MPAPRGKTLSTLQRKRNRWLSAATVSSFHLPSRPAARRSRSGMPPTSIGRHGVRKGTAPPRRWCHRRRWLPTLEGSTHHAANASMRVAAAAGSGCARHDGG